MLVTFLMQGRHLSIVFNGVTQWMQMVMNYIWNLSKVLMRFIYTLWELKVIKQTAHSQCHSWHLVSIHGWHWWLKALVNHGFYFNAVHYWNSVTYAAKLKHIREFYVSVAVVYVIKCCRQQFLILNSIIEFWIDFYYRWRFALRIESIFDRGHTVV